MLRKIVSLAKHSHILFCLLSFLPAVAQTVSSDSILQQATLPAVIGYALKNQPVIQQSQIDESIRDQEIKNALSDWYPQVNFAYNLQHNFQVPVAVIGGNNIKLGVDNTSYGQFTLKQVLFNPDVIFANRTKGDFRLQARQNTISNKIDLVAEVTKAYYNVLESMQQIEVAEGDITRLERSLQDATNQYKAGAADKIDYKRTTISLNNTRARKSGIEANLKGRMEYLKFLMNYPVNANLQLVYDTTRIETEIELDTTTLPDYNSRIEYQVLETQRKLQRYNVDYNRWSFLPTLSANGGYNLNYNNNELNKLYANNYPSSYAALSLNFAIFQGGKRTTKVKQAELELKRTEWDIINLKNQVNSEYAQAMAVYKTNYAAYLSLKENLGLAQEVYDVIQLQYRSGIKAYLEVITSETDLRNARVLYIAAVYNVLNSKVDVLKSMGLINY
jgi:outer membrane protein TolC